MTWSALGAVLPSELGDARLQLHWAAQLVSAPGTSLLPAEADYSHTSLAWDGALGLLAGRPVGPEQRRAGLVFEGIELVVLDGERERESLRLAGRTMQEALAWLGDKLCADPLSLPSHEMPSHPLAAGAPFSDAGAEERSELAAWFGNAASSIRDAVADVASASLPHCWPHHFDLASLITLDSAEGADEARSIGVGFSPGDGSYPQPYFYVTPWPYPDASSLSALRPPMQWHSEGWTGAVLTGERLISVQPSAQQQALREGLQEAIAASRSLLAA